jgi:hypothetical protein
VAQVQGHDEQQAFDAWVDFLRRDRPMGDDADRIVSEAVHDADPLTALNGFLGVWCWTASVDEHFLIANITRTENAHALPLSTS